MGTYASVRVCRQESWSRSKNCNLNEK
jgi:hypothetical protein